MDIARCREILDVGPAATPEDIRRAYLDLVQVWHPDRFHGRPAIRVKAEARLQEINEAYRILSESLRAAGMGVQAAAGTEVTRRVRRRFAWGWRSGRASRGASEPVHPLSSPRVLIVTGVVTAGAVAALLLVFMLGRPGFVARDGQRVRFVEVSLGGFHACGLDRAGAAYCWGADDTNQLGDGEGADACGGDTSAPCSAWPRRVRTTSGLVTIRAGIGHTCVLGADGSVHCWGAGFAGQTGTGRTADVAEPAIVAGVRLQTLSTLGQHTCGLGVDGGAYCWGSDDSGQLGDGAASASCTSDTGTFACSTVPVRVVADHGWAAVTAGGSHSCALDPNGRAWCWGSNRTGQLGVATRERCGPPAASFPCSRAPQPVPFEGVFTTISAGAAHTCGLSESGAAWCWGANEAGQLGDGTLESSPVPVQAAGHLTFTSIEARGHQTCAVDPRGYTWCWGLVPGGTRMASRACADGRCAPVPTPVRVPPRATVAVGFGFDCVIAGRTQECWGRNDYGQLGAGTFTVAAAATQARGGPRMPRLPRFGPVRAIRNAGQAVTWRIRHFMAGLLEPVQAELRR